MPVVLVIDRNCDNLVYEFTRKHLTSTGYGLWWIDSAGTRSVHYYAPTEGSDSKDHYDTAVDLPEDIYNNFIRFLSAEHLINTNKLKTIKRIQDPGLGIMLPEDFEELEQGKTPDGCFRVNPA